MDEDRARLHRLVDEMDDEQIQRLLSRPMLRLQGAKKPLPDPSELLSVSPGERVLQILGKESLTRLGIDPDQIGHGGFGWSQLGSEEVTELRADWLDGPVFTRLSMFHIGKEQIITLERYRKSEENTALNFRVRVLTSHAEAEAAHSVSL